MMHVMDMMEDSGFSPRERTHVAFTLKHAYPFVFSIHLESIYHIYHIYHLCPVTWDFVRDGSMMDMTDGSGDWPADLPHRPIA